MNEDLAALVCAAPALLRDNIIHSIRHQLKWMVIYLILELLIALGDYISDAC